VPATGDQTVTYYKSVQNVKELFSQVIDQLELVTPWDPFH
jgi:hypothetical protein